MAFETSTTESLSAYRLPIQTVGSDRDATLCLSRRSALQRAHPFNGGVIENLPCSKNTTLEATILPESYARSIVQVLREHGRATDRDEIFLSHLLGRAWKIVNYPAHVLCSIIVCGQNSLAIA